MLPAPDANGKPQNEARCLTVQARLFDYLDGELSPSEMLSLRAHLDVCAACCAEEAVCRQSERALASVLSHVPAVGDLRPEFYARLAASNSASRRFRWQRWSLAVPALAAAGLAAFLFLRHPSHSTPTGPVHLAETERGVSRYASPRLDGLRRGAGTEVADIKNAPEVSLVGTLPETKLAKRGRAGIARARYRNTDIRLALLTPPRAIRPTEILEREALVAGNTFKTSPRGTFASHSQAVPDGLATDLYSESPSLAKADAGAKGDRGEANTDFSEVSRKDALNASHFRKKETGAAVALGTLADAPAHPEEVSLHVEDEERGFTATMHVAGAPSDPDSGPVITIESSETPADDAPAPDR